MSFYSSQVAFYSKLLPKPETVAPVIEARQLMDRHYSEPIDLDELAGKIFLSKFHFVRLFKRCYGRTPHEYLTERRMMEAKRFLATGMSVEEACFKTGYSSATSFALLFRRHTGWTPSVYRKMRKNR